MRQNFHQTSYLLHIEHAKKAARWRNESDELPSIIASPGSIDAHRHERMYDFLRPLVGSFPLSSWMTIGDTGADAFWLKERGVKDIMATSLTCDAIDLVKDKGYLEFVDIKAINAEYVDLPDDSVDIVLCKETFHHLPRAPVAFYELLRVCRKAVVYIEPAEPRGIRLLDCLRSSAKRLLRRQASIEQIFEVSGNFIYKLSENELRKQATAMQLDTIAFRYFNDFYHSKLSAKKRAQKSAMMMFKFGVAVQDFLCTVKLMNYARIVCIVFKNEIDQQSERALRGYGYSVEHLPQNPYV